ncbi:hypothetical protein [Daejeonella sp.]|uniref:hypothetical protein n=1 Tax=Daejeonella sp. TaxID=2805397 RepID=UPI0030C46641
MKYLHLLFFTILPFLSFSQLRDKVCDEKYLTAIELEKCQLDSVYVPDVQYKLNFIVSFKSNVLPKFRVIKRKLKLSEEVKSEINLLSRIYDSVLSVKSYRYEKDGDKNTLFIQPNSYLSTVLSMQIFKIYPDIYAVLLNPIHLQLNPKTSKPEIEDFENRVNQVYKKLSSEEILRLSNTVQNLKIERSLIPHAENAKLFQGQLDETAKLKYEIVNFLLWNN